MVDSGTQIPSSRGHRCTSSHDDELRMNATFASWLREDDEAHLLVRWLLEAEFLDAYKGKSKTIPNKGSLWKIRTRFACCRPIRHFLMHCSFTSPAHGLPCQTPRENTAWVQQVGCSLIGFVVRCWEAFLVALMKQLPSQSEMKAEDDEGSHLSSEAILPSQAHLHPPTDASPRTSAGGRDGRAERKPPTVQRPAH